MLVMMPIMTLKRLKFNSPRGTGYSHLKFYYSVPYMAISECSQISVNKVATYYANHDN